MILSFYPNFTFDLMAEIIGLTSIVVVSMIFIFIALRRPKISNFLYVALILRVFVILLGHYVVVLPDSSADAHSFEWYSWLLAKGGFFDVLSNFNSPHHNHSFFFFLAIPYSLLGRSFLMLQSFSLFFGMGTVYLGWKVANILWNNTAAKKVGWTIALFPSLILYSALIMREVYIGFFLLVAIYGICKWYKTESFKSLIIIVAGFSGASLLHGTLMVGGLAFAIIFCISAFKKMFISIVNNRLDFKILIIFLLVLYSLQLFTSNKISVSYLGSFAEATDTKILTRKTIYSSSGKAAWPKWLSINSTAELIYKAPMRSLYFVFAPFPWNVKATKHFIGMFDSFLYMYLVYLISINIKDIWRDPSLRIILLLLLVYIFIYGFGVGNFGTGIRHRSKFVILFILLAGPYIHKLNFFKKLNKI